MCTDCECLCETYSSPCLSNWQMHHSKKTKVCWHRLVSSYHIKFLMAARILVLVYYCCYCNLFSCAQNSLMLCSKKGMQSVIALSTAARSVWSNQEGMESFPHFFPIISLKRVHTCVRMVLQLIQQILAILVTWYIVINENVSSLFTQLGARDQWVAGHSYFLFPSVRGFVLDAWKSDSI